MIRFVEGLGARAPVVVALEDLHWADSASIALVERLLGSLPRTRALVVATFRPEETDGLRRLSESGARRGGVIQELTLHELTEQQDRDLLAAIVGAPSVAEDVEKRVLALAQGNPLFLEEQLRLLRDEGVMVRRDDGWSFPSARTGAVPETIEKVFLSRLDRLAETSREIAVTASVLGSRFDRDVLAAVVADPGVLETALEELGRLDVVRQIAGSEFAFGHAMIQETAYRSLLRRRRRELHGRVADVLEAAGREADEEPSTLAHHLLESDQRERALPYLVRAGDHARSRFAHEEAVAAYRRALETIQRPSDETGRPPALDEGEDSVRERLGYALADVGRLDEAIAAFERCIAAASMGGDAIRVARLETAIGSQHNALHEFDEALAAYERAERALGTPRDDRAWWDKWFETKVGRLGVHYWRGEVDRMRELIEEVRPFVERGGTALQRSEFFDNLATLGLRRSRFVPDEETLGFLRESLAASRETGDDMQLAWARFQLGFGLLWHDEPKAALPELQEALRMAERTASARLRSRCLIYTMVAERRLGRADQAERTARDAEEAAEAEALPEYVAMAKATRAWVAWRRGDHDETELLGVAALAEWEDAAIRYPFDWMAVWPLAEIQLGRGHVREAARLLERLLADTQQPPRREVRPFIESAVAAERRGDVDGAARALDDALRRARQLAYL